MYSLLPTLSLPQTQKHTQFPARSAHTRTNTVTHRPCHAEKQVQTRSILSPRTAQPPLPYVGTTQRHNAYASCSLVLTAKHIQPHTVIPCIATDNHTYKVLWAQIHHVPTPWTFALAHTVSYAVPSWAWRHA